MKRVLSATAALILSTGLAAAADVAVKAPPPAPAPPPSIWDVAFGAAVMSDYNFRGISQSDRNAAVTGYFEPRFNITPNVQLYAGIAGWSISFPNNAAAEIDFYGGIRPTFGPLALDFGAIYYYYPGGQLFTGFTGLAPNLFDPNPFCTNLFTGANASCNAIKEDLDWWEVYGKATYTFNPNFAIGAVVYYTPDWLHTGGDGTYAAGNVKFTGTPFPNGVGWYVSGEIGHYWLGTTDGFYLFTELPDYLTWNAGFGLTWSVFTLDFRYYDTDTSKAECNVLTGDHTAFFSPANITPINPSGLGSRWCDAAFVIALKGDLTYLANIIK
jgi:Bacterial protein of unknown function (Gcw_chp)